MLLFVNDRTTRSDLRTMKDHLMRNLIPEVLKRMMSEEDVITIALTSKGEMVISIDGSREQIELEKEDPEVVLGLLGKDASDDCIYLNRIAFFSEGFDDIVRSHRRNGSEVTVLVKDLQSFPGMHPVTLDKDLNLQYRLKEDLVRSKTFDLNMYVLRKEVLMDHMHEGGRLVDIDIMTLPQTREDLRIRGHKVRSKMGFSDDPVSILEFQRMVMDTYINDIQKTTSKYIGMVSDQIINMPVYLGAGVSTGAKCRLGPYATILDNVKIGDDVFILNSILGEGCSIEDDCYIEGAIIGPGSMVRKGSEVEWSIV